MPSPDFLSFLIVLPFIIVLPFLIVLIVACDYR